MNNASGAMRAWRAGNDAGEGFAPGPWLTDRETTVEEAIDELLDEPRARLRLDLSGDGIQVVERADGKLVGVCDAEGAWAVLLS